MSRYRREVRISSRSGSSSSPIRKETQKLPRPSLLFQCPQPRRKTVYPWLSTYLEACALPCRHDPAAAGAGQEVRQPLYTRGSGPDPPCTLMLGSDCRMLRGRNWQSLAEFWRSARRGAVGHSARATFWASDTRRRAHERCPSGSIGSPRMRSRATSWALLCPLGLSQETPGTVVEVEAPDMTLLGCAAWYSQSSGSSCYWPGARRLCRLRRVLQVIL